MRSKASTAARLRLEARAKELERQIAETNEKLQAATVEKQMAEAELTTLDEEERRLAAWIAESESNIAKAQERASELRALADAWDALAARASS